MKALDSIKLRIMGSKKYINETSSENMKLLSYFHTCLKLITGEWLSLSKSISLRARDQFIAENNVLALVCALLFTSFLPTFYSVSESINKPGSGLALDLELSYFNSKHIQYLPKSVIHDIFLFIYTMAMGNAALGTLASVFNSISTSKCTNDAKTMVFLKIVGKFGLLPYYFFTFSIVSWAFGAYFTIILTSQTLEGLVCTFSVSVIVCVLLLAASIRNIQGLYAGVSEEQDFPPIYLDDKEIEDGIIKYFQKLSTDLGINPSISDFLLSLSKKRSSNYIIPLHLISKLKAKRKYYEELKKTTLLNIQEVTQLDD